MDLLKQHINSQFFTNRGKNLLNDNVDSNFKFVAETASILESLGEFDDVDKECLVAFATDKALEEFCKLNQYYSFDARAKNELRKIYDSLFDSLRNDKNALKRISSNHYKRLREWLVKSNPFAEKIYKDKEDYLDSVPCSEYSAETQLRLLNINLESIQEPILDIGCGTSNRLIDYLYSHGLDVLGIDRFTNDSPYSKRADWLGFDYGIDKWGTIISNLGFSNHFKHHHLRADGNYVEYAKTYMSILNSLKVGGRFYYAPDLPFIEGCLNENKFQITQHNILNTEYDGVILEKLK